MSSDYINSIGANSARLNQTSFVAPQRAVTETAKPETSNSVSAQAPVEGFSPTAEARESLSDTKAGEAKASEILGAWGTGQTPSAPTAGSLSVTGASNTAVNQVHGVSGGVYQASNGVQPGFTDATVFASRPPQS